MLDSLSPDYLLSTLSSGLWLASVWAIPLLVAITMHEAAHGFVAARFGDMTATMMGRVTLNPLRHVDLFGTIVLPGFLLLAQAPLLFGWAKPVPVRFGNLRPLRKGIIAVALAGPGTNLGLALISALLLWVTGVFPHEVRVWLDQNLLNSVMINLVLMVLNLLPIPPLDGGRVMVCILPPKLGYELAKLEKVGMALLLGLFFIPPLLFNFSLMGYVIGAPVYGFLAPMLLALSPYSIG